MLGLLNKILVLGIVLIPFIGNAQPVIITQPSTPVDICKGLTGQISVVASGSALTYQWFLFIAPSFDPGSPYLGTALTNSAGIFGVYSAVTTPNLTVRTRNLSAGFYQYYCRIVNSTGTTYTIVVDYTILPQQTISPTVTGATSCGSAALTLTASGAPVGAGYSYKWYLAATGGASIFTGATYFTPVLASTTTYYVEIEDINSCRGPRVPVMAQINPMPSAPTTTGNASCGSGSLTIAAAGGIDGEYRWYTVASGGTSIAGEVNSTYLTPFLTASNTYYVSINNSFCEGARQAVLAQINPLPTPPTTTGNSACGSGSLTLTASGGTDGEYRWYTVASGGTAITGETNSSYTTPNLGIATTFYVSIDNGVCEGTRSSVLAQINIIPTPPTTTGNSACGSGFLTLIASGGTDGEYRWYTVASGGMALTGEVNSTYITPVLTTATTFYVSINDGVCEGARVSVLADIKTMPSAPTTTGNVSCGGGSLTLSATGGTDGEYRWYSVASGGAAISGEVNSTYATPSITTSTTFYVSINNGACEGARQSVLAQINPLPATPSAIGDAVCGSGSLTLTASGGTNGQYRWYDVASGGTAISGQSNESYTTPTLTSSTTYYVSIDDGTCEGVREAVIAIINPLPNKPIITIDGSLPLCVGLSLTLTAPAGFAAYLWSNGQTTETIIVTDTGTYTLQIVDDNGCTSPVSDMVTVTTENCLNQPPTVASKTVVTQVGGIVTISLLDLLADPDDNLDLSSLEIVNPPASGALASIDNDQILTVDYSGISFAGVETLRLRVCDLFGSCAEADIVIEVTSGVVVYNAVSPNGDGKHDFLFLQYIDTFDDTKDNKVTIFNRWGTDVFVVNNYDNVNNVFRGLGDNGKELPSGTYYYRIAFVSGKKGLTGFLSLRR